MSRLELSTPTERAADPIALPCATGAASTSRCASGTSRRLQNATDLLYHHSLASGTSSSRPTSLLALSFPSSFSLSRYPSFLAVLHLFACPSSLIPLYIISSFLLLPPPPCSFLALPHHDPRHPTTYIRGGRIQETATHERRVVNSSYGDTLSYTRARFPLLPPPTPLHFHPSRRSFGSR